MRNVLVAGATGYLGQFVLRECQSRGYRVRALVRNVEKLGTELRDEDEVREGQITQPDTLKGVCDRMDVVFSSVGITKQKDKLTFHDVDYQGNLNLLNEAIRSGVKKFVYVSVFNGRQLMHLDIVKAHEDFVEALKKSGIDYTIIRPTGYFSDMGDFLRMARYGHAYLIGDGSAKMNPIHGADLAEVCVDGFISKNAEVTVGGPEVMSYREIASTAFAAYGNQPKYVSIPPWMMKAGIATTRLFNRHAGELLAFFAAMMTRDMVAPQKGHHELRAHFDAMERGLC